MPILEAVRRQTKKPAPDSSKPKEKVAVRALLGPGLNRLQFSISRPCIILIRQRFLPDQTYPQGEADAGT